MVRLPLTAREIEQGKVLGSILRRARAERTILDVALESGISPETLRKIETGRVATPAFSTIAAVAMVLDLSLDHIWSTVNAETPLEDSTPVLAQLARS
ncbi:helix-turn-helix domain-containing protein [Glutamicibacter sp.]|uniref:helix-turn-helix domain-containing protein n=1 Tax=Glutamicibacter sp. TaxID=1931995 RepID=UPI002FE283CC